jgi:hypothetical protein
MVVSECVWLYRHGFVVSEKKIVLITITIIILLALSTLQTTHNIM